LNIAPRSLPTSSNSEDVCTSVTTTSASDSASEPVTPKDKWDSIFSNRGNGTGDRERSGYRGGDRFETAGRTRGDYRDSSRENSSGFGGRTDRREEVPRDMGRSDSRFARNDGRSFDRSRRNNYDEEGIDDPRFAGKFGSSSRQRDTRSDNGQEVESVTINEPKIQTSTQGSEIIFSTATLSSALVDVAAEPVKKVDEKKAAKQAVRLEAEKKEQKEREEREAAIKAEKEKIESFRIVAAEIYASGKKGTSLVEHIASLSCKPSAASLVSEIISHIQDPCASATATVKWCSKIEFGAALSSLLEDNPKEQLTVIHVVQKYCSDHNFPKVDVKDTKKPLVELFFQVMCQNEIIEPAGFIAWADDEREDIPGKQMAVIQTSAFMKLITDDDDDGDYEA